MADWSQLPYELTALVVSRVDAVEDFISISSVCKSWRAVCLEMNWNSPRKIPWLMLGDNLCNNVPLRQCFSMTKFKVHSFPKHDAFDCLYWGSSLGWVVTVNKDEMYLHNPISRARIDLPSQSASGSRLCCGDSIFDVIHRAYVFNVGKSLIALVIYGPKYDLAFVRAGDDSVWSIVQSQTPANFCNVVCFQGRVLALSMVGKVYLIDIDSPASPPVQSITAFSSAEWWLRLYLVESSGRLLMVVHHRRIGEIFRVFGYNFGRNKWERFENVGDVALLVDDYNCISVPAHGILRRNSVYHTIQSLDALMFRQQKYVRHYVYVYDLKENSVVVQNEVGYNSQYSCPTWLVPALW